MHLSIQTPLPLYGTGTEERRGSHLAKNELINFEFKSKHFIEGNSWQKRWNFFVATEAVNYIKNLTGIWS